jgi:Holliday junction DNA helicase RuvA
VTGGKLDFQKPITVYMPVIISLEGCLVVRKPLSCVLEANGIGYEIFIPLLIDLPPLGKVVKLWTYAIYREDSQTLYGFNEVAERDFFKLVVEKVSGIGPKTALGMLSKFKLKELHQIIASRDTATLAHIPGIGRKTAEKVILDLADKMGTSTSKHSGMLMNSARGDAILGLIALGYKRSEAEEMIAKIAENLPDASTEELIKNVITVR